MKKKYFLSFIICVCIFSFLGGLIGQVITDYNLLAEERDKQELSLEEKIEQLKKIANKKKKEFYSINSKIVKTRQLELIDDNNNTLAIFDTSSGQPRLCFYTKNKPLRKHPIKYKEFSELIERKGVKEAINKTLEPGFNKPKLIISTIPEPIIGLTDKDRDLRISLSVNDLEPRMFFYYRGKTKLQLGTSSLVYKPTNRETEIEGSIASFNNKGKVLDIFPSVYK